MIQITPAILPKSWSELEEGLAALVGVAPRVQLDVVRDIFGGHEALPQWEEFDFEFDLYVEPAGFVPRALELGATSIIVHARHATAAEALAALQQYRAGDFPVRVGLALRSVDTPAVLAGYEGLYDFVQVMGIDNEGRQGEPFDALALELVRALCSVTPHVRVQVDGHVAGHEHEFAQAGAVSLVVGSAIMHADNPRAAFKEIYTRATRGQDPI